MLDESVLSQLTEDDIKALNDFEGYLEYLPTQVWQWLLNCPCKIKCLFSGNQFGKNECLSYQTLIDTPNGQFAIGKLYEEGKPFDVYAWDGNKKVVAKAKPPFLKPGGERQCFRITMSDGRWIECSGEHRILTVSGDYISADNLFVYFHGVVRERVCEQYYKTVASISHLESNSGFFQQGLFSNVQRSLKTLLCIDGNYNISIVPIPCQEVYDFEVEKYHNYFAGGLIHHNSVVMDYYLRIWGKHPQDHLNVKPEDKIRTFRFASENLPGDNENEEVRNTQYPVLKRRFNPSWILKDITARKSVVSVQPQTPKILPDGTEWHQKPVQFEFVSYGQSTQAQAGVQRRSVYIDESAPKDFFDEQIPRLLAADGDLILSYTPIPGSIGWEFDELYDRARIIYRTMAVRKRIYKRTGVKLPAVQYTDSKDDIAVIMAATDDNPIYAKLAAEKSKRVGREITADEYITEMLGLISDEDVIDARRYGLFKQLSGNIFKGFDQRCHIISREKYFPEGLPYEWKHFRGIDWHEATPWACGWIAVSPHDEIFIYNEFNPSPERMVTMEIARVIATRSQDYKFDLNLIDPLSAKIQPNTGLSSLEDLNRLFAEYKKQGIGTGGHWQVWDTKSQKGRDEIRKRLQNAALCGVPFNNEVKKDGITKRLPTLWVLDNCIETIKSLKNWRREEWGDRSSLVTKDEKETPQQKWSHFCTMLEGLMKRPEVFAARFGMRQPQREAPQYFNRR
jgi:hypothetical protein